MGSRKDANEMIKILGAILTITGCCFFGMKTTINHKTEEKALRSLIEVLIIMECELRYRLTPLPELCRQASIDGYKCVKEVFRFFADELDNQISPNAEMCMYAALRKVKHIPDLTYQAMVQFGKSVGRFDISGQLDGLDYMKNECTRKLAQLTNNQEIKLRRCQTLWICAGAAIVILFV